MPPTKASWTRSYHVSVNGTNGFNAWDVHLLTPTTRGQDARNTDGIDPGHSTNIMIGSETYDGQSFLLVDGLTEDHTTSGIRIKGGGSKPDKVHDRFATVTVGAEGTNLDFGKTEIKVVAAKGAAGQEEAYSGDGRFVPMQ